MKNLIANKKFIFIAIPILIIFMLVMNCRNTYRTCSLNEKRLKEEISLLNNNIKKVDLKDVTPFEWDKVYMFAPYVSREDIYKKVGYKWYLIRETVNEGMNQVIFMKDKKVVCYLYGYPENIGYLMDFDLNKMEIELSSRDKNMFEVKKYDTYKHLTYDKNN